MARALSANGAKKVYILGRRLEVLETAARDNQSLVPVQCDVTKKDSLQAAVDKITAESGHVNLLVANSGVVGPPIRWNPALSMRDLRQTMFADNSMDGFTDTLDVNVTAAFFTMTAFLELLEAGNERALAAGGFGGPGLGVNGDVPSVQSQVVITSSIAAFSRMSISAPAYASSKAAVLWLTKHSSSMLAKYGIRVNALSPGRE